MDLFFNSLCLLFFHLSALCCHKSNVFGLTLALYLSMCSLACSRCGIITDDNSMIKTFFFFFRLLQYCDFYTPVPICVTHLRALIFFFFNFQPKTRGKVSYSWVMLLHSFMPLQCQCRGLRNEICAFVLFRYNKKKKTLI